MRALIQWLKGRVEGYSARGPWRGRASPSHKNTPLSLSQQQSRSQQVHLEVNRWRIYMQSSTCHHPDKCTHSVTVTWHTLAGRRTFATVSERPTEGGRKLSDAVSETFCCFYLLICIICVSTSLHIVMVMLCIYSFDKYGHGTGGKLNLCSSSRTWHHPANCQGR